MKFEQRSVDIRLPSTWRREPLAHLVTTMCNGTTALQNKNGVGLPVTRIETISEGFVDYRRVRHVDLRASDVDAYRLGVGDVLLSHINSVKHIGKVARYDGVYPLIHGMNLLRIVFDTGQIDQRFGYYSLSSKVAKRYFESKAKKAISQASLNKKDVGSFPMLVPPLFEQQKIVSILSSFDEAIEKTQAVIDQVESLKRGLMLRLLTRGITSHGSTHTGELPRGWQRKRVGELGKIVTGSTPSTKYQGFWNGRIPFVTPADLGSTMRVSRTGRHVTQEGLAKAREIPPGSVMVTCIASIGKVGIAEITCCTNQQINSIVPDNSIVLPEYLYYAISFRSERLLALAGITAVPIVSKSRFITFGLLIPPIHEQNQIVRVLANVDQVIEINRAVRAKLTQTKHGLMSVLLTGELRVAPEHGTA